MCIRDRVMADIPSCILHCAQRFAVHNKQLGKLTPPLYKTAATTSRITKMDTELDSLIEALQINELLARGFDIADGHDVFSGEDAELYALEALASLRAQADDLYALPPEVECVAGLGMCSPLSAWKATCRHSSGVANVWRGRSRA